MKILLTNDDGYASAGIQALYDVLSIDHDVLLAAPEGERSAIGHGITLHEPLRMHAVKLNGSGDGYAVSGTPADCIKLGLYKLYSQPPDLVISGINPGSNAGINLNYSGTVGAAREATLNNIPSIAISIKQGSVMDYEGVALFVAGLGKKVVEMGLPTGTFLNVNVPDIPVKDVRGIKITRQASTNLSKDFEKRRDPKENLYYWYSRVEPGNGGKDTDISAVAENYISITPIQCDVTDYKTMLELEGLTF